MPEIKIITSASKNLTHINALEILKPKEKFPFYMRLFVLLIAIAIGIGLFFVFKNPYVISPFVILDIFLNIKLKSRKFIASKSYL